MDSPQHVPPDSTYTKTVLCCTSPASSTAEAASSSCTPQAPDPNPNDGLCFKCGLPGHRSRNCSQNQNQLALPSIDRNNARGNNQPRNNNAKSYGRAHTNHVDLNEAQDQPATVMGTLLVNSVPASVLFDTGASHSFMSEDFAYKHDVKCEEMNTSVLVKTPVGQCQTSLVGIDVPMERRAGILCLSHYPEVV